LSGNEATAYYPVKIDKTAPVAAPTQAPSANAAGWNNTDVVVTWNWSDTLSGLDTPTCAATTTATAEGTYNVLRHVKI
jgi:large repetitive protein